MNIIKLKLYLGLSGFFSNLDRYFTNKVINGLQDHYFKNENQNKKYEPLLIFLAICLYVLFVLLSVSKNGGIF